MTDTIDRIAPDLRALAVPLTSLRADPKNAKAHTDVDLAETQASYARFGQRKPVVALPDGTVIDGNGQLEAARRLGWTHLAVARFEDEKEARAYALAANRTSELSGWNNDILLAQLEELAQHDALAGTGFDVEAVMKIAAAAAEEVAARGAEEKAEAPPAQPGGDMRVASNHVRMVQLFLNDETHPPFMDAVRQLGVHYAIDNVTDVVREAVVQALKKVEREIGAA